MTLEPLLLLRDIREVCILAEPEHPEKVTQRAFDQARSEQTRFVDIPRADRIVKHLKLPWRKVLASAHGEGDQVKLLVAQERSDKQDWLTEDHVAFCLKLVALRLGADTVTQQQYHDERESILAENTAQQASGVDLRLPTEHQIMQGFARRAKGKQAAAQTDKPKKTLSRRTVPRAGTWNTALRSAGLAPTSRDKVTVPRGLTSAELIERCYQFHGTLPSSKEAEIFARANHIPYNRKRQKLPWQEQVATWRASRRKRRLPAPDAPPPMNERPDYSRDMGASLSRERRNDWSDPQVCLTHVASPT
jgi:hypothetical protein